MRNSDQAIRRGTGFTLLEVLITVVVIGIAATAIMGVFIGTVRTSANPLIQQQAVAIAEAYMEEIQLKQFCHPSPPPMQNPPPQAIPDCTGETGTEEGAARALYNDVQDYNHPGIDGPASDQNGVAIADLANYQVTVDVDPAPLGGVNALRIKVEVDHPAIDPITISGFRMNY